MSNEETIKLRQKKQKVTLITALREGSTKHGACVKAGIDTSTIYRWMDTDEDFKNQVQKAEDVGRDTINDMGESVLYEKALKEKNWQALKFFLEHRHPTYIRKSEKEKSIPHFSLFNLSKTSEENKPKPPCSLDDIFEDMKNEKDKEDKSGIRNLTDEEKQKVAKQMEKYIKSSSTNLE